eukprot:gene47612-64886_t
MAPAALLGSAAGAAAELLGSDPDPYSARRDGYLYTLSDLFGFLYTLSERLVTAAVGAATIAAPAPPPLQQQQQHQGEGVPPPLVTASMVDGAAVSAGPNTRALSTNALLIEIGAGCRAACVIAKTVMRVGTEVGRNGVKRYHVGREPAHDVVRSVAELAAPAAWLSTAVHCARLTYADGARPPSATAGALLASPAGAATLRTPPPQWLGALF